MIDRLVAFQARARPHAPAISTPYGSTSFLELERDIERMARALAGVPGFEGAERIGVQIANPVHFWLVALGCWRSGRLVVSLGWTEGERRARLLALCRPDIVFSDRDPPDEIGRPATPAWIGRALAAPFAPSHGRGHGPDDKVLVLTTSGTTGEPKPFAYTRRQLEWRCRARSATEFVASRAMSTMGFDTIGGMLSAPRVWSRGGCVVYPASGFRWADVLASGDFDHLAISPAQAGRILDELPAGFESPGNFDVMVSGSALPSRIAEDLERRVSRRLYVSFGTTEAGLLTATPYGRIRGIEGAAGYVLPSDQTVEIVDPAGEAVPAGRSGELRIRSAHFFLDYDGAPSEVAFRHGAFYTGDVARLDADGLLVIKGRTGDILNIGGEKYAPLGIEETLRTCEGVHDVAAFAAAGADGLDQAHAALVVGESFRREDAHAAIRRRHPLLTLELHGVAAIPRNAMGKIDRAALRRSLVG